MNTLVQIDTCSYVCYNFYILVYKEVNAMLEEKIKRINELSRKAKTPEGLTDEEAQEQATLRKEYIEEWRQGVTQVLDNTYIMDEHGNKHKLEKKK